MKLFKSLFGSAAVAAACTASAGFPTATFNTPDGSSLTASMICHGSLAFTFNNINVYIDPVSEIDGRQIDYASMPKADFIFITHDHYDHFDVKAIEALEKEETVVVLNSMSWEKFGKGKVMSNGDNLALADNVMAKAVPAYNNTEDHMKFHPQTRNNGYLFDFAGLKVYVSGDTEDIEEMAEFGPVDVAFLSTNQPYTMTPEQCVNAVKMIRPKVVVPYHLGDTDLNLLKSSLEGVAGDVRIFESLR